MKDAYKAGFNAKKSLRNKSANPYNKVLNAVKYYAWIAGYNDCDIGHELQLKLLEL